MNVKGKKSGEQITLELVEELGRWVTTAELMLELLKRGLPSKNVGASLSALAGSRGKLKKHKYTAADGQLVVLYGALGLADPEPLVSLVKSVNSAPGSEVTAQDQVPQENSVAPPGEVISSDLNMTSNSAPTAELQNIDEKDALDSAVQNTTAKNLAELDGLDEPKRAIQDTNKDETQVKIAQPAPTENAPQPAKSSPVILKHRLLDAAGVPDEAVAQRGYMRATSKAELRALGFAERQAVHVPALVVPVHGPDGSQVTYLLYPDAQVMFNGRIQRYLLPKDAPACLDVPPSSRKHLQDDSPIVVVDDVVQADAVSWHCRGGLCGVALVGLGCAPGPDMLPEWRALTVAGRTVLLVLPWPIEAPLHQAYTTLQKFLAAKGARVGFVCVPEAEHCGRRSLSDFLAKENKTFSDLLLLKTDVLPPPPVEERPTYERTPKGLVWNNREGERVPLANFNALITRENIRDDDISTTTEFDIDIEHEGETLSVRVGSAQFRSLRWAETKAWARIYSRQRDKVSDAVRYLSGRPHEVTTYTHTGWRKLQDGSWGYLHGGGAITADGLRTDVLVDLPHELRPLRLPPAPEGQALHEAIRAILSLLDLSAKDRITAPLFALVGRAPLGSLDSTPHLVGQTGAFKSSTAQLIQRALGSGFHRDKSPLSWLSTGNANELALFASKDALVVVDDFRKNFPHAQDEAERLIFAQGNQHGRSRMAGGKAVNRPPRGLMLSTGEDIPTGVSLRSRMIIIEIERGDILLNRLTECQARAAAGVFAEAFSGYVRWLAPRIEGVQATLHHERGALQAATLGRVHKRTEAAVADLMLGVTYFLHFALETGALSPTEAAAARERCLKGLIEAGQRQANLQAESDPVESYFAILRDALALGEAHLALLGTDQPAVASDYERWEQWGWRPSNKTNEEGKIKWEPCGRCVGWLSGDRSIVYLLPRESHGTVVRLVTRMGMTLTIGERSITKALFARGLLVDSDIKKARRVYTVRPSLVPGRPDVLHLRSSSMWPETDQPDQAAGSPSPAARPAGHVQDAIAARVFATSPVDAGM